MAQKFYVVESHDTNKDDETRTFTIQVNAPTTNMSGEEREDGWLGTTNDIWEYAHGAFDTIEAARAFIQIQMPGAGILENDEYDQSDDEIWGYDPESLWTAGEWLGNSTNAELEIEDGMSDEAIEKIADDLEKQADDEGAIITDSIFDYLKSRI
jgi:hypothetical protein